MVLPAYDGRSLSLDLGEAFGPAIQEAKQRRETQEITNLARTASGLPPVPEKNAGGFLAKVAPGLADTIQKLNQNRQPDLVDEARSEAEIGLDTSRRILAAKSAMEKQKIILERAEQVQSAGGDATELLRMSSLSPAEIDLQAQKTAMTSDAALKTLPAPTDQERAAARAELAVRNPQALNAILRQEQLGQQQALAQRKLAQQEKQAAAGKELVGRVFGGGGGAALPNDPLEASTQLIAGFEGFRETPYFDVNALRTGFGSDTVTLATGEVMPVTEGTVVTQEDALRDLQRRITTEFAPRAREAVTPEIYDSLSPQQQAALNSITYNYGSLPDRVASVARTGDVQATAQAIAALGSDNEGINADRRAQEAQIFAGGGQPQQPQQISQQEVIALLSNPGVPQEIRDFAVAEYERQIKAQQEPDAQEFQITELADGLKYYVDPTGRVPARLVDPTQQAKAEDVADFETEQKLRKEFSGVSTVEDFYKVSDAYRRVEASATDPSAAGDLALIFNYMKMLDPNSVVRETEFATAQNAAGVPERIRALFNRTVDGQRLTEETRSDFVNRADLLFQAQASGFNEVVGQYRALAQEYGLEPDRIARKAEIEGKPPEQAAQELAEEGNGGNQTQSLTDDQLLQKYGG